MEGLTTTKVYLLLALIGVGSVGTVVACATSTEAPKTYEWCDAGTWPQPQEVCAEVKQKATDGHGAIDIVIIVDNSGSMDQEANAVQENLNGFASKIAEEGYDTHVVLISKQYPHA